MVIPYWEKNQPMKAAEELERASVAKWAENNPQAVDDISAVVVFITVH